MLEQLKVLIIPGQQTLLPCWFRGHWSRWSLRRAQSAGTQGAARHGAVCGLLGTAGQTPTTLKPVPPGAAWFVKTQFLARRTNLQEIRQSAYEISLSNSLIILR